MTGPRVIIPIRGLTGGKSRLATQLGPWERSILVGGMATHVIETVAAAGIANDITIVSREPDLLRTLRVERANLTLVHQSVPTGGLNAAIDLGRHVVMQQATDQILVLLADLPLLTARALVDVVSAEGRDDVVLGTDDAGVGTNALLLSGATAISRFTFRFGLDSRRLHRLEADRIGVGYAERTIREIALDLDTPSDWAALGDDVRRRLLAAPATPRSLVYQGAGFGRQAFMEGA